MQLFLLLSYRCSVVEKGLLASFCFVFEVLLISDSNSPPASASEQLGLQAYSLVPGLWWVFLMLFRTIQQRTALLSPQSVPVGCDPDSLPASTVHFDGVHENKAEAERQLVLTAEQWSSGRGQRPLSQVRPLSLCLLGGFIVLISDFLPR